MVSAIRIIRVLSLLFVFLSFLRKHAPAKVVGRDRGVLISPLLQRGVHGSDMVLSQPFQRFSIIHIRPCLSVFVHTIYTILR